MEYTQHFSEPFTNHSPVVLTKLPFQKVKIDYEGQIFIGKLLQKINGQLKAKYLEMTFGIHKPQATQDYIWQ